VFFLQALAALRASILKLSHVGATHECGPGDLLETGGAHALARRRGERTTSQHFEGCVCVSEGIWERALVLVVLISQKQQSAKQSQHHARRLAADAVVARFLPPPRAKADLPTCSGDWQDCCSTTLLYHHTLPRWTDSHITTTSQYLQSVDVYEDMTCSQPANQSMHSSQCG
jgi:hypothetical protein